MRRKKGLGNPPKRDLGSRDASGTIDHRNGTTSHRKGTTFGNINDTNGVNAFSDPTGHSTSTATRATHSSTTRTGHSTGGLRANGTHNGGAAVRKIKFFKSEEFVYSSDDSEDEVTVNSTASAAAMTTNTNNNLSSTTNPTTAATAATAPTATTAPTTTTTTNTSAAASKTRIAGSSVSGTNPTINQKASHEDGYNLDDSVSSDNSSSSSSSNNSNCSSSSSSSSSTSSSISSSSDSDNDLSSASKPNAKKKIDEKKKIEAKTKSKDSTSIPSLPQISDVELKTLDSVLKRKRNESLLKNYLASTRSSPIAANPVTFGPSTTRTSTIASRSKNMIVGTSKEINDKSGGAELNHLASSSKSILGTRNLDKNYTEKAKAKKVRKDDDHVYNSGAFTKTEREKVKIALDQFLYQNDIPVENLHYLIHSKSSRLKNSNPYLKTDLIRNFSQQILELADINRSDRQLYYYMRNAYSYLKGPLTDSIDGYKRQVSRWTPEQDQALLYHVTIWGTSRWKKIEHELGMFGAKDRYDCLQGKKLGHWTAEEDLNLYHAVREIMREQCLDDPTQFNSFTLLASRLGGSRTYREVSRHFKRQPPSYWLDPITTTLKTSTSTAPKVTTSTASPSATATHVSSSNATSAVTPAASISPISFKKQKKLAKKSVPTNPAQWDHTQFIDLLTRIIFHFPDAKDESELKWSEMINSSDVMSASALQSAWRHLVLLVASRWPVEEMTLGKVVEVAMNHIKELVP